MGQKDDYTNSPKFWQDHTELTQKLQMRGFCFEKLPDEDGKFADDAQMLSLGNYRVYCDETNWILEDHGMGVMDRWSREPHGAAAPE